MQLKELLNNSVVEFLSGDYSAEQDFVALSVMTDGLKADRDSIIGLSGVNGNYEALFTILFNVGSPDKTAAFHGIPLDKFKTDGVSPQEGWQRFLSCMDGKYLVMHNHKFSMKFINEFCARHDLPPMDIPYIGSEVLNQAMKTNGTLFPVTADDVSMRGLVSDLDGFAYPKNTKKSLPTMYGALPKDSNSDYIEGYQQVSQMRSRLWHVSGRCW